MNSAGSRVESGAVATGSRIRSSALRFQSTTAMPLRNAELATSSAMRQLRTLSVARVRSSGGAAAPGSLESKLMQARRRAESSKAA